MTRNKMLITAAALLALAGGAQAESYVQGGYYKFDDQGVDASGLAVEGQHDLAQVYPNLYLPYDVKILSGDGDLDITAIEIGAGMNFPAVQKDLDAFAEVLYTSTKVEAGGFSDTETDTLFGAGVWFSGVQKLGLGAALYLGGDDPFYELDAEYQIQEPLAAFAHFEDAGGDSDALFNVGVSYMFQPNLSVIAQAGDEMLLAVRLDY